MTIGGSMSLSEHLLTGLKSASPRKNDIAADNISLVGDDGVPIPACRFLLSGASPVFRQMLFGKFAEASSSSINIHGYDHDVLRAMVRFCRHHDFADLRQDDDSERAVATAVDLVRFAHTYDLPHLQDAATEYAAEKMEEHPPLACLVFSMSNRDTTPDLCEAAFQMIINRPLMTLVVTDDRQLGGGGIRCLSPSKLGEILQKKRDLLNVNEFFLFRIIEQWKQLTSGVEENALEFCKVMGQLLDLSLIEPMDLKSSVLKCDFIEKDRVLDAFMDQAVRASRRGTVFSPPFRISVKDAGRSAVDGVYKHSGYFRNGFKYSRHGQWKGELREFALYRHSSAEWRISIVPMDDDEPPKGDIAFYKVDVPEDSDDEVPPVLGWQISGKGHLPVPCVSFLRS